MRENKYKCCTKLLLSLSLKKEQYINKERKTLSKIIINKTDINNQSSESIYSQYGVSFYVW